MQIKIGTGLLRLEPFTLAKRAMGFNGMSVPAEWGWLYLGFATACTWEIPPLAAQQPQHRQEHEIVPAQALLATMASAPWGACSSHHCFLFHHARWTVGQRRLWLSVQNKKRLLQAGKENQVDCC